MVTTAFLLGVALGGLVMYLWASLQLAKRDPPHGLTDEALAERATLDEAGRMDAVKARNRENARRRVRAQTT